VLLLLPNTCCVCVSVLLCRGTEPLELADFQSDFDAVPEAGEWGCLHPGAYLALVHFNLYLWVLNYRMQLQQRLRNQGTSTLVLQLQPCVPDRSPQGSCGRGHLQSISRCSKPL
jgi:hypothetical protein